MRITALVKPNSKDNEVQKKSDSEFTLRVKAAAREGQANRAAISLLSEYLGIPKSRFTITHGKSSRTKIIDIN